MVPERRRSMIVSIAAVVLVVVVALVLARQGSRTSTSPAPSIEASAAASASAETSQPPSSPSASPTPDPTPTPTPSPSPTSSATDLTGTWTGTWTAASPDTSTGGLRVTWTQEGSDLTGTMIIGKSACAPGGAVEGSVTGDNVTFTVPGTDPFVFTGTLSGSTIAGSFTRACDAGIGTFSLARMP